MWAVLRWTVGGTSTLLFVQQFYTINQIPFDLHYHPDDESRAVDFKKGNYVLSHKYFQHEFTNFKQPKVGDLVLYEMPDRSARFKIVRQTAQKYFLDVQTQNAFYVPQGFVVLYDPLSEQEKMQNLSNIRGSQHHIVI